MSVLPDAQIEQGTWRLDVALYNEDQEQVAQLKLPVTHMGWALILKVLEEYSKPACIIKFDSRLSEQEAEAVKRWWTRGV